MRWVTIPLQEVVERFISGGTPSTSDESLWHGNLPWITGADFGDDAVTLGRRYINKAAVAASATNVVPANSVLLVTRTGVGKSAIAEQGIAISQDITGMVPKTAFEPRFILYAIKYNQPLLISAQRGATIKGVTRDVVRKLPIPYIGISEQRRIVELLDEADRLRKLRRDADAKAARILPALFLKMFGDPATNPKGLPTKLLGNSDVCDINPRARSNLADNTPVSFVPMADVDEILGRVVGCQVRPYIEVKKGFTPFADGDVLFAKITPCMQNGKAAIVNGLTNAIGFGSTEFHVLRAGPSTTAEFLFSLVRLQSFRNHAMTAFTGSAGQQRVPADFLKQYRLPLPPISDIQEFSKLFRLINAMLVDAESAARKLEMQFSVLLQRAFSGQLTAKWREAHMKELLAEMEQQARLLNLHLPLEAAP